MRFLGFEVPQQKRPAGERRALLNAKERIIDGGDHRRHRHRAKLPRRHHVRIRRLHRCLRHEIRRRRR